MEIFVEQMTPSASGNPRGITVVMIIRICFFYCGRRVESGAPQAGPIVRLFEYRTYADGWESIRET